MFVTWFVLWILLPILQLLNYILENEWMREQIENSI